MHQLFLMATAGSPEASTPVPRVEQVGEAVVGQPGDLAQARQAQEPPELGLARRAPPDLNGAIGANVQAALRVDAVQPAANVLDSGGKARERVRLGMEVPEFDPAGPGGAYQRFCCRSMPALHIGQRVLYHTVNLESGSATFVGP